MEDWYAWMVNTFGIVTSRRCIRLTTSTIFADCSHRNLPEKNWNITLSVEIRFVRSKITYVELLTFCFWTGAITKLSIDCFNAGATVGFNVISSVSSDGRFISDGLTGSRISFGGSSSTTAGAGFSGSTGLTFECFDSWHPLIFKNSVKSTLFLLQHDHPLYASWKNGVPGWWRHASTTKYSN